MHEALICYSGSSPSQNGTDSPDSAEPIIPSYSTVHVVKSSVSIECVCVCVCVCACVCVPGFLIRSYGAPNGIGRCLVVQYHDKIRATLAQQ